MPLQYKHCRKAREGVPRGQGVRVAEIRIVKIIMCLLGNLSNKSMYNYTEKKQHKV